MWGWTVAHTSAGSVAGMPGERPIGDALVMAAACPSRQLFQVECALFPQVDPAPLLGSGPLHDGQPPMAKVLATEVRAGNLIEWDKRVWRVLKSYHVHVGGRGGAFMQVEMKDIESGTKNNQRFRTDEKIERAFVEARDMEYLYNDGDTYIFMDKQNYEQLTLPRELLEGQVEYLLPNTEVQVNFHNERPIGVQLPPSVVLTITETEPTLKGATATGSFKPAKTETGLTVQVPPFVGQGEKIKVNTDSGEYIERV
jgi:elongation factor P